MCSATALKHHNIVTVAYHKPKALPVSAQCWRSVIKSSLLRVPCTAECLCVQVRQTRHRVLRHDLED